MAAAAGSAELGAQLLAACVAKDSKAALRLAAAGAAENSAEASSGNSPLILAALHAELGAAVAERLLQAGAAINSVSKSGDSALICACYKRAPAVAQLLLRHGAAVNVVGSGGATALDWAERGGLADVARSIRARCGYLGADSAAGLARARELSEAIARVDVWRSVALIEAGADYNSAEPSGAPALVLAARRGDAMLEVSTMLLSKMDGLGMVARATKGVLDAALRGACSGIAPMTIKLLVAHGADPEAGGSLLGAYAACDYGHAEAEVVPICAQLLALGADVNGLCEHRGTVRTPLCHALYYHKDRVAELLLDHHADAGKRGSDNKSALEIAAAAGVFSSPVPKALARLKAMQLGAGKR
jgi:ankyrin repeat protein